MKIKDKSALENEGEAVEPLQGKLGLLGADEPHSSHLGARLRGYFLTGLIVVGPIAITVYVVWWFISQIDNWVKPLIPSRYLPEHYLPFTVPGVGLIVAIGGLVII